MNESTARLCKVISLIFVLFGLLTGCGQGQGSGGLPSQNVLSEVGNGDESGAGTGTAPAASSDPNCQDAWASVDPQISARRVEVCILVNKARAENGVAPLLLESLLSKVAQDHAADMAQNKYFSHTSLNGQSPFDRMRAAGVKFGYAAENIATGSSNSASVMDMWMNSSGHRTNILNPRYRKLGVGEFQKYWVQTFTD